MSGYLDDSYNNDTVVVGGWIAHDKVWDVIQKKWDERIAYEGRISAKNGLMSLTRYHASDCASRHGEFEGWTIQRQIALTKRLVTIMTNHPPQTKPLVFAFGFSLWEAKEIFKGMSPELARRDMYRYCVVQCLREIGGIMQKFYTNERITFIHEIGRASCRERV